MFYMHFMWYSQGEFALKSRRFGIGVNLLYSSIVIVLFSQLYFKGKLDIGQTLLKFKGLSVLSIVL